MTEQCPAPARKVHNFITDIIDADLREGRADHVVTRFPPEPNGYLHIGHAKSICVNFGIALQYGGTCNLRFDDTNPIKEDLEYVRSIEQDVQWLGFAWDGPVRHSSDYFDQLYGYALELIDQGLAYVDELSPEEIRAYRGTLTEPGTDSPWRDRPIAESRRLFTDMKEGRVAEGRMCLRARIDMASPFICMRDPVLYRVRFASHELTGDRWCIYPMYDFTHCISDAIEGITHSICTLEFQDNRRLYDWVLDHISIAARPHQYEMSRLNLEYSLTSKRKLNLLVEQGVVDGWDDPRLTTISGLRRRGYTPASIREFCARIGVTKQDNTVEMTALEACIRDDLNHHAPRVMAVLHPLRLIIDNYGAPGVTLSSLEVPNHPQRPELGRRTLSFSAELYIDARDFREEAPRSYKRLVMGGEVRLRYGCLIRAVSCERDAGGTVTAVHAVAVPDSAGREVTGHRPRGVIHWVDAGSCFFARVILYGRLFRDPNPAACDDILAAVDPDSRQIIERAALEPSLQDAPPGTSFQFEREGYFCVDSKAPAAEGKVFNLTVPLRETRKSDAGART